MRLRDFNKEDSAIICSWITTEKEQITLGVFINNKSALHCYESAGFHSTGEIESYHMPIGDWDCIEMEL